MVVHYLIILLLSPFLVTCSSISSSSYSNSNTSFSSFLCHPDESASLLGFINSMTFNSSYYDDDGIGSWKKGSDCCGWDGITCDPTSHHVVELDLYYSGVVGTLDSNNTLFHLRHLRQLDLSFNDFSQSPISPMFGSSFPYLEQLILDSSNFRGEVPLEISQLSKLHFLSLLPYSSNVLEMKMSTLGSIISNMTHLIGLYLGGVNINSTIPTSLTNSSSLKYLELSECNLRGELPANVLTMPQLQDIRLGRNNDLHANFILSNWSTSFQWIDLSNVNFSSTLGSINSQYNQLEGLYLRGCSLYGPIPDWVFSNETGLTTLDLSDNKFNGTINLNYIHSLHPSYGYLNISHNYLTGSLTRNLPWNYLVLDLSYNMFDGSIPIPPFGTILFSVSNNKFTGSIPSSLCNLTSLQLLDLSNNGLMNELPYCLYNLSDNLNVLNLGSNDISGTVPAIFSKCDWLEYLDLSDNWLEGLGPQSLAHCNNLQVINLRNNKVREEFPQWVANLSNVQLLDLSCNSFFGSLLLLNISSPFPRLQVLDLSNNNFSGIIPRGYIESFKAMTNITQSINGNSVYLDSKVLTYQYFYSATLTRNGVTLKYDKIITTLATFDLSNNKFEGEIPNNLGKLVSIHGLNLSHNQLTGPIPPSLGNLTLLDFLDLSYNKLTGQIPQELTRLTFLEVFNVSKNQLIGPIPHGNNFNTYSPDSYNGNLGLCGNPLPDCGEHGGQRQQPSKNDNDDEDLGMMSEWMVVMMGCGFGIFVSFVWGCYMLSIGRPLWLLKLVLILVDKVEKMFGRRRRRPKKGRN